MASDSEIISFLSRGRAGALRRSWRRGGQSVNDAVRALGETRTNVLRVARANRETIDTLWRTRNATRYPFTVPAQTIGDPPHTVGTAPVSGAVRRATFTLDADWTPDVGIQHTVELDRVDTTTLCYINLSQAALANGGSLDGGTPYDMEVYDLDFNTVAIGSTPVTAGETIKASTGGAGGHLTPAGVVEAEIG